jgi:hypothetical protein
MLDLKATPSAMESQSRRIVMLCAGATALMALVLLQQRSGVSNPFEITIFRHLLLFQDVFALLPWIAILLAALAPPVRALGLRLAGFCGRQPGTIALLTAVLLAAGSHVIYHTHPLSMDEYAAVFQSRVFAEGRLTGQLPAALADWLTPSWLQERFIRMSPVTGEAASIYWPGHALLLTPFTALNVPWLLNPLIGGATVLVMHRLGLALLGSAPAAGLVVLLTIASPAVTINALSYYAMPAHLLFNGLYALLLIRPGGGRALLAGAVGSYALVLHNPAPHLMFCIPWLAWLAWRPERRRDLISLLAGYLPLAMLLGWGWSFFVETVKSRATVAQAATVEHGVNLLISRLDSVLNWPRHGAQLYGLAKLWLWSVPAMVLAALLGAWQLRRERGPWLPLIGSALLTYFAYFLVRFDQGHGWGFRYFHSAWLVVPLLAAAAAGSGLAPSLRGLLAGCALLSLPVLTALFGYTVEHHIARHRAQAAVLVEAAAVRGSAPRVVILDPRVGYYTWDLAQQDPFMRDSLLHLMSREPKLDREMMARVFPQYTLLYEDRRGTVWGTPRP